MNKQVLRWGIIGLGNIAHKFVQDLLLVDDVKIQAVASRSANKAIKFAQQYDVPNAYGSYDELLQDADVDIVYIATPHNSHAALSIAAMNAGKHVLCEKPIAVNEAEMVQMIDVSRKNKVFMMEAFWSRFNPSIKAVLEHVKNKTIGEVNYVNADFSFLKQNITVDGRLLNMSLAGGSLLDIGVYPIFIASAIFGVPEQIQAAGHLHQTGADIQMAATLKYKNGLANLMSGLNSPGDMRVKIYGTKGRMYIHAQWHFAQGYSIVREVEGKMMTEDFSLPTKGKGFTYEIEECKACIAQNKTESPSWSHQNSLDQVRITDEIRRQIGVKYPFE